MKHRIALAAAFVAALGTILGCGSRAEVSREQAVEAFNISFSLVLIGSMSAAYNNPIDGISLDEVTGTLTFQGFDLADYGMDSPYTTVDGTASAGEDGITVDLRLGGGVVRTMRFHVSEEQLQSPGIIGTTVEVNGRNMEIEVTI